MELFLVFDFDASHRLPCVPDGHKCGRMHGHTFRVDVHVEGPVDPGRGWVMDFADLRAACAPVIEELDHRCLNEVEGLENPTSENLAAWLWERLRPSLPGLSKLVVRESERSGVIYRGEAT